MPPAATRYYDFVPAAAANPARTRPFVAFPAAPALVGSRESSVLRATQDQAELGFRFRAEDGVGAGHTDAGAEGAPKATATTSSSSSRRWSELVARLSSTPTQRDSLCIAGGGRSTEQDRETETETQREKEHDDDAPELPFALSKPIVVAQGARRRASTPAYSVVGYGNSRKYGNANNNSSTGTVTVMPARASKRASAAAAASASASASASSGAAGTANGNGNGGASGSSNPFASTLKAAEGAIGGANGTGNGNGNGSGSGDASLSLSTSLSLSGADDSFNSAVSTQHDAPAHHANVGQTVDPNVHSHANVNANMHADARAHSYVPLAPYEGAELMAGPSNSNGHGNASWHQQQQQQQQQQPSQMQTRRTRAPRGKAAQQIQQQVEEEEEEDEDADASGEDDEGDSFETDGSAFDRSNASFYNASGRKGGGGGNGNGGGGPGSDAGGKGGEQERFECPHCNKAYTGKHARSIWRRHLQDKHSIPLSLQPRRTRWDGDTNRPKNAEERRERMLESKRRWARKKRLQDKAVALGLPPDTDARTIQRYLTDTSGIKDEDFEFSDEGEGTSFMSVGSNRPGGVASQSPAPVEAAASAASQQAAVAAGKAGKGAAGKNAKGKAPARAIATSVQPQVGDDLFFRSSQGGPGGSSQRGGGGGAAEQYVPIEAYSVRMPMAPTADYLAGIHSHHPHAQQIHQQQQQQHHQQQLLAHQQSQGQPHSHLLYHMPAAQHAALPHQHPHSHPHPHQHPHMTPVQHYSSILQPTPPSSTSGPSNAEREMHAMKQKMLSDMFGSKYRPLPSPPTSNDKGSAIYHSGAAAVAGAGANNGVGPGAGAYGSMSGYPPLVPPSFVPRSSFLPRGSLGGEAESSERDNGKGVAHARQRTSDAQDLQEATETAATQLLALSSPPKPNMREADLGGAGGAGDALLHLRNPSIGSKFADSPTASPLTRSSRGGLPTRTLPLRHAAASPRSNSVSAPVRRNVEDSLDSSPKRHASVEPGALDSATRMRRAPSNPFSLDQHKISPPLGRKLLPSLEAEAANSSAPAGSGAGLGPPARLDALKLPPLVATPAFEVDDPVGSLKRKASEDEQDDTGVSSLRSVRSKRIRSMLESMSPVRRQQDTGAGSDLATSNLFTPFTKSILPGLTDTGLKSVSRHHASLLSTVGRPSRKDDLFSSPQHLALTSSLGLAPGSVLRGNTAGSYGIDTPAPISRVEWPATANKVSSSNTRATRSSAGSARRSLRSNNSSAGAGRSSSPLGSDSPLLKESPTDASSQQRKLANETTPSRRGQRKTNKPSPMLTLADGSPVKRIPA